MNTRDRLQSQLMNCMIYLPHYTSDFPEEGFNQKKILVVDDESFNIIAIKSMLKGMKLANFDTRVDSAYSGETAIELFKESIYFSENIRRGSA